MPNDYFTINEIAKEAGISRQAVHKRIKARKVPVRVFGKTLAVSARAKEKLLSPGK